MNYNIPQVWQINKNIQTPLFKQLADNIKWSIISGNIQEGWKLPPIRVLAKELDISVGTVRSAYKYLEESGLIITRPHHGTEVLKISEDFSEEKSISSGSSFTKIIKKYLQDGYSAQEISKIFAECLEITINDKKILFIECDPYDEKTLAKQLASFLGCQVDFLLLDKTARTSINVEEINLSQYKAIVTTYFHYTLVMQEFSEFKIPIFAVVTEFSKETTLAISKFKSNTKIAVLCTPYHSPDWAIGTIASIRDDLDIRAGIITDSNSQESLIHWADACFPNHPFENIVKTVDPNKPVYFFCDQINSQSIGILKENLNALA